MKTSLTGLRLLSKVFVSIYALDESSPNIGRVKSMSITPDSYTTSYIIYTLNYHYITLGRRRIHFCHVTHSKKINLPSLVTGTRQILNQSVEINRQLCLTFLSL